MNFLWTTQFFGLRLPEAALIDIILHDSSLVLLVYWFYQASKIAGLLLAPYLGWVLFATCLNAGFCWLN
jgi:benzodiazapine receptor